MPKIIVDASTLCYKAKFTMKELTLEEMSVGVIFGVMGQILKLAEDLKTNDISFCWDSNKSHRRKLFPAYKERRHIVKEDKTPEEIEEDRLAYLQFDQLYEEIIPQIGFKNSFKIEGYEGDDLIASIVYSNPDDDFIIVTGDEDMFQLLGEGVAIRRSRLNKRGKKEHYLFTEEIFTEQYGITPHQWIEVKALAGCKSDEVPGIKGIGEATAIQFLREEMTPSSKRYRSIKSPEGRQVRQRNLPLVSLPFKGTPDILLEKQGHLSFKGFCDICNRFEFLYYLRKENLNKYIDCLRLK